MQARERFPVFLCTWATIHLICRLLSSAVYALALLKCLLLGTLQIFVTDMLLD